MALGLGHLMGLIGGRSPQIWANRVKKVPVERVYCFSFLKERPYHLEYVILKSQKSQ